MKFVVDKLYSKCGECEYCADGLMQSPLGVAKQINLCMLQTLVAPKIPNQEPNLIDPEKSPIENNCPCGELNANVKSSIIL